MLTRDHDLTCPIRQPKGSVFVSVHFRRSSGELDAAKNDIFRCMLRRTLCAYGGKTQAFCVRETTLFQITDNHNKISLVLYILYPIQHNL